MNASHYPRVFISSARKCHLSLSKCFKRRSLNCTSNAHTNTQLWFDLFLSTSSSLSVFFSILFRFCYDGSLWLSWKFFFRVPFPFLRKSNHFKRTTLFWIRFSLSILAGQTHHTVHPFFVVLFCFTTNVFQYLIHFFLSIESGKKTKKIYCRIINGTSRARLPFLLFAYIYSRHRSHF